MAGNAQQITALMHQSIKPLLDAQREEIIKHVDTQFAEIMLMTAKIEKQLQVLEGVVSSQKKATTRSAPKETAAAVAPALTAAPSKKTVSGNKLIFFRNEYKENEAFRNRYAPAGSAVQLEMLKDTNITSKAVGSSQRLTTEATFAWSWLKNNDAEAIEAITKEHEAAKIAEAAAAKGEQLQVKAVTPPEAKK